MYVNIFLTFESPVDYYVLHTKLYEIYRTH